jgi:16S rRNA C967 or C1407 C5-methylase (RsmB/RsmF family)
MGKISGALPLRVKHDGMPRLMKKASPPSRSKPRPPSRSSGAGTRAPQGLRPRPVLFRELFRHLWKELFESPVHLDSLLSRSPPSQKEALAVITPLLLRRPRSLAHFLRFNLSDFEPWDLSAEELGRWFTAGEMADRLFQSWKRDPSFMHEGQGRLEDYPDWMTKEWIQAYGGKTARELAALLAETPPLTLRMTSGKNRNHILSALNDSKAFTVRAKAGKSSPVAITFSEYQAVKKHPLSVNGTLEIQDEGSQVLSAFSLWPETIAPLLRKVPGPCREWPADKALPVQKKPLVVIDACAGAGGKSLALASMMGGKGQVFAYDVSEKKLLALRQRSKRLGLYNIKTALVANEQEATLVDRFREKADVVLVDAPCSGWGVLRRNPDLKWRQTAEERERLEDLQMRLLESYGPLVKPGGRLVYGLCSFRPQETEKQIEKFLERNKNFKRIAGGYFGPGPSDGFYMCALEKIGKAQE